LFIVLSLLLAFALVGHSLFLARGIHDCGGGDDCFVCITVQGVMTVAGQSVTTVVAAFIALSALLFIYSLYTEVNSVWNNTETLVNFKIRMNN
jgi:hypothetical protein